MAIFKGYIYIATILNFQLGVTFYSRYEISIFRITLLQNSSVASSQLHQLYKQLMQIALLESVPCYLVKQLS